MRIVLTGGGTGGHIYPALSVAQQLAGEDLLYVGSAEGPEARLVPSQGCPFRSIPTRKLSRRLDPQALVALGVSAWGVVRALTVLREFRPNAVLGTGGYASAGIILAAAMLRIPTIIHEANAVPGRANLFLARWCTRVAVTFDATRRWFPSERTVVTGVPIRGECLNPNPRTAREQYGLRPDVPTLLVSGGSGGARTLNRAVLGALPLLAPEFPTGLQLVHQTGREQHDEVTRTAREMVPNLPSTITYLPLPYVEAMPSVMAASNLVICRAGSSTLAELTATGLPSILVPYPFAVGDHQTGNARALEGHGAALVVPDAELDGPRLVTEVSALLRDPARLNEMAARSRACGRPDAAARVAQLLRELAA